VVIDDGLAFAPNHENASEVTLDDLPERSDPQGKRVHLTAPSKAAALLVPASPFDLDEPARGELRAHAYQFVSRVFSRPRARPRAIGFVRRNQVLHAEERVEGPGCERGAWYRLRGRGYVCSRDGFALSRDPRAPLTHQRPPSVADAMPFAYAKADEGILRYHKLPTASEEEQVLAARHAERRLPDYVDRTLDGVFLLALDRLEAQQGPEPHAFHRTVRGQYVRADQVTPKPEPGMRGELLSDERRLPIAFVYGTEPAPLYRRVHEQRVPAGTADLHSRFMVAKEEAWDGVPMLVATSGIAVERSRARLVKTRDRRPAIPPGEKWIHVDLDEQALVAYEGDRPVFATLVSSGKGAEFATPTGLFRVREKHISTTMSGPDPDAGYYEVEEVPWTLYYQDSYALHGAYWHDEFGNTRSHGCTNISPVDARWLFYWTAGTLPRGWNALRKLESTWVYLTRELPPQ
jgi:hypothetical protein